MRYVQIENQSVSGCTRISLPDIARMTGASREAVSAACRRAKVPVEARVMRRGPTKRVMAVAAAHLLEVFEGMRMGDERTNGTPRYPFLKGINGDEHHGHIRTPTGVTIEW